MSFGQAGGAPSGFIIRSLPSRFGLCGFRRIAHAPARLSSPGRTPTRAAPPLPPGGSDRASRSDAVAIRRRPGGAPSHVDSIGVSARPPSAGSAHPDHTRPRVRADGQSVCRQHPPKRGRTGSQASREKRIVCLTHYQTTPRSGGCQGNWREILRSGPDNSTRIQLMRKGLRARPPTRTDGEEVRMRFGVWAIGEKKRNGRLRFRTRTRRRRERNAKTNAKTTKKKDGRPAPHGKAPAIPSAKELTRRPPHARAARLDGTVSCDSTPRSQLPHCRPGEFVASPIRPRVASLHQCPHCKYTPNASFVKHLIACLYYHGLCGISGKS